MMGIGRKGIKCMQQLLCMIIFKIFMSKHILYSFSNYQGFLVFEWYILALVFLITLSSRWSVFVEAVLLYGMITANDSNIFGLLYEHVFKQATFKSQFLCPLRSCYSLDVSPLFKDCYVRGWRQIL